MTAPTLLTTYLADTDEPCPNCKYNLRGLTGNTCPECNERIRLRVALEDSSLAWFIGALIGLSAGAGFFSILLTMILSEIIRRPNSFSGPHSRAFLVIGASWLVLVGALATVVLARRRLARLTPGARRTLAISAWILSIAAIIILRTQIH